MKRLDQKRPVGWFPPWMEWLGGTIVFWLAVVVLVISLVLGWILRCSGN